MPIRSIHNCNGIRHFYLFIFETPYFIIIQPSSHLTNEWWFIAVAIALSSLIQSAGDFNRKCEPKSVYAPALQCWPYWWGVPTLIMPIRSTPTIWRIVVTRQPSIFRPMVVSVFCHGIYIIQRTVPTKSGSIMSLLKSSSRCSPLSKLYICILFYFLCCTKTCYCGT